MGPEVCVGGGGGGGGGAHTKLANIPYCMAQCLEQALRHIWQVTFDSKFQRGKERMEGKGGGGGGGLTEPAMPACCMELEAMPKAGAASVPRGATSTRKPEPPQKGVARGRSWSPKLAAAAAMQSAIGPA